MNRVGGVAHLPGGVGADLFGSGGIVWDRGDTRVFDSTGGRPLYPMGTGDPSAPSVRASTATTATDWDFQPAASLETGTEGAYSLSTAFNQGRWIAEIGGVVYWVYAVGGTSKEDLYGDVILEPAFSEKFTSRFGSAHVPADPNPGTVQFNQPGYTPALVMPPPGTSDAYMVVYIGERIGDAIPLLYSWMPTESSATVTPHSPEGEVDGIATTRCSFPVGEISEDGAQAFVVYTLSQVNYTGGNSDYDTTRRVRLLRYSTADGAVEDAEVDTDTVDAGFSHSHFPSVAVSSYRAYADLTVVLVVWRSFYPDPDPDDDTDGWSEDNSAIRGRVYIYDSDGNIWQEEGPFDIASPTEGEVYASDPSVIGLGNGDFLIAFTAKPSGGGRGSVHTRLYTVPGGNLGEFVRVEPDGAAGTEATFPHKFPSLATNAAKDRVLVAYEVGKSGSDFSHGTRVAAMLVSDPTVWTTMPLTDGDGDGECDPTSNESDLADLVGDLGLHAEEFYEDKFGAQQTINPCVLIRSTDEDFVGFVLRDNMDIAEPPGTNTMSLELYAATVPW